MSGLSVITYLSSVIRIVGLLAAVPFNRIAASTAANGMHQFDPVAVIQGEFRVLAAGHNVFVNLDRDPFSGQREVVNQSGNGHSVRELHRFTVYLNLHSSDRLRYFFRAAATSNAQPTIKQTPPTGVTGPSQWVPVRTSK